jgi:hypothetical protein
MFGNVGFAGTVAFRASSTSLSVFFVQALCNVFTNDGGEFVLRHCDINVDFVI